MTKCSICRLEPTKIASIDSSLRTGAVLQVIADENGLTKSALWRHSRHVAGYPPARPPQMSSKTTEGEPSKPPSLRVADLYWTPPKAEAQDAASPNPVAPALAVPKVARQALAPRAPLQPPLKRVPAPASKPVPAEDTESKRRRADRRFEALYAEAMEGLEAAKQPVVIQKGDGTTLEVPGDLRARAAFIRAGQSIVDSQAKLNDLYESQEPNFSNLSYAQVIMLPKLPSGRLPETVAKLPAPAVIEAVPEPASHFTRKPVP